MDVEPWRDRSDDERDSLLDQVSSGCQVLAVLYDLLKTEVKHNINLWKLIECLKFA